MPKYICSECGKILIRNAHDMRRYGQKSYCGSKGKEAKLTRLRIRRRSVAER